MADEHLVRPPQPTADRETNDRRVLLASLALLVLAPVLGGLLTFERIYSFTSIRYFALPVLAAEILFLAVAFQAGHSPARAFARLSVAHKSAWAVWFLSALAAGIWVAPVPSYALLHLMITVAHALVALAIWDTLKNTTGKSDNDLVLAMICGIALFAVATWAVLFAFRDDPDFDWLRVGFGVSHVRHLSYFGVLAAGAGFGFAAYRQQGVVWFVAMTGIAVGSALSLWSGSRAGVIATLVSAVVALALAERGQRIRAFIRMATGFLAGVLLSLIWIPPHSMWGIPRILGVVQKGGATIGEVASNRDLLWLEAIRLFRDQPLIGYGEGQFRFLNRAGWPANHPHDVVLQFLVQWGLVGTLAMIVVAWHAIPHSIRRWQKPLPRSLPALCALVAVGAEGIVDGPLFYAYPTLAVGILLVVLGNSDAGPRPKTPGVRP